MSGALARRGRSRRVGGLLVVFVTLWLLLAAARTPLPAAAESQPLVPTTFRGQVSSPATAGIVVTLYERIWVPGSSLDEPWVAVATTVTAGDGSFALGPYRADPPSYYTLGFKHPSADWSESFLSWTGELGTATVGDARYARCDLFGAYPVSIALRGSTTISGAVIDEDGAPVALADISLMGGEYEPAYWTTTDADGRYSISGVRSGDYVVYANEYATRLHVETYAPAAATRSAATVYSVGVRQAITANVTMRTTTPFTGALVAPDGTPVAGAAVHLYKWDEASSSWTADWQWDTFTVTDASGKWLIHAGDAAGRYKVAYYPDMRSNLLPGFSGGATTLDDARVTTAAAHEPVAFRDSLAAGGQVTALSWYQGNPQLPETITLYRRNDATGVFSVYRSVSSHYDNTVRAVPPGTYRVEVLPWGEWFGNGMRSTFYRASGTLEGAEDVVVTPDSHISIETTAWAIESIAGRVTSSLTSRGVDAAEVSLWRQSAGGSWTVLATQVTPDDSGQGSFGFTGVSAGTYRITLRSLSGAFRAGAYPSGSGVDDAADITLARGAHLSIDPTMAPVMGTVSGVVRDSVSNDPIPGAVVEYSFFDRPTAGTFAGKTLTADSEGAYRIESEGLTLRLSVTDPAGLHAGATRSVDIVPGVETTADVALSPLGRLTGTVVDSETGKALAGIQVVLSPGPGTLLTDAGGAFATPLVASGWYFARFTDPSGVYLPLTTAKFLEPGGLAKFEIGLVRNPDQPNPRTDFTAPKTVSDARASYPGIATIRLTAADEKSGSGLAGTYYILDHAAAVRDSILSVPGVGGHSLEFWSVDVAGNIEVHNRVWFTVKAVPARTLTFTQAFEMPKQHWDFADPRHATVDASGLLWVSMYDRLNTYSADGSCVRYDPNHAGYVRRAAGGGVWVLSRNRAAGIDRLGSDGRVLQSIDVTSGVSGPTNPVSMAVSSSGELYVVDSVSGRVLRYRRNGTLAQVFGFGTPSALLAGASGGLYEPAGAAVDASGSVYVAETGNKDIQQFTSDGTPSRLFACADASGTKAAPLSVDLASNGDLLVNVGPAIWRFSTTGVWLGAFCSDPSLTTVTEVQMFADGSGVMTDLYASLVRFIRPDGAIAKSVGASLNAVNPYNGPTALAFGRNGRGYVTDGDAHVHMINDAGKDLGTFALPVTPVDNAWPKSGAVALDSAGNVYVPDPDYFVQQINRYSPDGVFIDTVLRDQEAGPGIGFGTNGHLYATCVGAGAVVRFDQDMRYVGSWRSVPATLVNYVYSEPLATSPLGEVLVGQQPAGGGQSHGCVLRFGLDGKRLGEIVPRDGGDWPAISAVAVAPDGTVFVAYPRAAHVEYYSASGVYQGELHGTAERPFAAPNGLAFDRFGRLWVADGGQLRCFTVKGLGRSLVTLPAAVLPVPTTTGALRRGRSFVISGELRPRHATGTQAVTLFFYQYRSHRWVLGKTVKVRVTDYASYSRYSVSTSLPRSGTWRVRASHSDVSHRASYSGYRTLAVK